MQDQIKWGKSESGWVDSKCGRFAISPVFRGREKPDGYRVRDRMSGCDIERDTQRDAKEQAEIWAATFPGESWAPAAAINTLAEWGRADAGNAGETGADVPGAGATSGADVAPRHIERESAGSGPVTVSPADVMGFREWWNDYLTPARFAEHKEMTESDALALIARGRAAHDYGAPHARDVKALNADVVLAAGEHATNGRPVALLYRPAGYRPAGSRSIWRDATLATRWTVDGTPYGLECPADAAGAYRAALDYVRRTRDVWGPSDRIGRMSEGIGQTFAGIGFGLLGWIEWAPDPRPGMESGVKGRPAHLIIGERARDGLLVTLAFEGDSVSRVDVRPDEYRPIMAPRHIAREHAGA